MPRSGVKLRWIKHSNQRKNTFRKRSQGLLQKVEELTILCDVTAFVIIYNPDTNQLTVWPDHQMVEQMLERFRRLPDDERTRKMVNQETYLMEKVAKLEEKLKKTHTKTMNLLLSQIYEGNKPFSEFEQKELTDLDLFLRAQLRKIEELINFKEGDNVTVPLDLGLSLGVNGSNNFGNGGNMTGDGTEMGFGFTGPQSSRNNVGNYLGLSLMPYNPNIGSGWSTSGGSKRFL